MLQFNFVQGLKRLGWNFTLAEAPRLENGSSPQKRAQLGF